MSPEERDKLQAAIQTLADPKGNWSYGWKILCELAGVDQRTFLPPFRENLPGQQQQDDSIF
jgi:hypothetical protein